MHVLLLTYHYPPSGAVGGIRPAQFAEFLRSEGHRVTVVTARLPGEVAPLREAGVTGDTVTFLAPRALRHSLVELWTRMGGSVQSVGTGTTRKQGARTIPPENLTARLRRWIMSGLWTPDDQQLSIFYATAASLRVHRSDRVDLLYTTAPPFSIHLAGCLASTFLRIPWIAEFRDPWTEVRRAAHARSYLSDRTEEAMERCVLRNSDVIVAVTNTIGEWLSIKMERLGRHDRAIVSLNGLPTLAPHAALESGEFEILHAGSIYLDRDPRPVLAAVAEGIKNGAFRNYRPVITFLGAAGNEVQGVPLTTIAEEMGLKGLVRCEPQIPTDEARLRMARSSALLLLAQNQAAMIPNKLFDYLAAKRPIIAIGDAQGESLRLLRQVGGHYGIDPSEPGFAQSVVSALNASLETPAGYWDDNTALEQLSHRNQYRLVLNHMKVLHVGTPPRHARAPR